MKPENREMQEEIRKFISSIIEKYPEAKKLDAFEINYVPSKMAEVATHIFETWTN